MTEQHGSTKAEAFPRGTRVYEYIAERIKDIVGDSIVVVNSYDPRAEKVTVRAALGVDEQLATVVEMTGRSLKGWSARITERAKEGIASGRVHEIPDGLYEAMFRELPRGIARLAQKACDLPVIKSCGMVAGEALMGTVVFAPRGNPQPSAERELEVFLREAAMALHGRQAADN